MVNEKSTIKDLELEDKNAKHYVDRLTKAHYGVSVPELFNMLTQENKIIVLREIDKLFSQQELEGETK